MRLFIFLILCTVSITSGQRRPGQNFFNDIGKNIEQGIGNLVKPFIAGFSEFAKKFHREGLGPLERALREGIFKKTLDNVLKINEQYERGDVNFLAEINEFADWTDEEKESILIPDNFQHRKSTPDKIVSENDDEFQYNSIPREMDWVRRGKVAPPRHQGKCMSCWAFSSIACLESHYAIRYNRRVTGSEQELIDCVDEKYDRKDKRCEAPGWVDAAYEYIRDNRGISANNAYPYREKRRPTQQPQCPVRTRNRPMTVRGFARIEKGNEEAIRRVVGTVGPVAVEIDCTGLFSYKRGVWSSRTCKKDKRNHAVVIVGYGRERNQDYWLVKNTWGKDWGDKGYFKMVRGKNMCGVAEEVYYPVL